MKQLNIKQRISGEDLKSKERIKQRIANRIGQHFIEEFDFKEPKYKLPNDAPYEQIDVEILYMNQKELDYILDLLKTVQNSIIQAAHTDMDTYIDEIKDVLLNKKEI